MAKNAPATAGQTILQIAAQNGIEIPNLCENGQLKHYAGCGLCVVEAEGCPKLLRACSTIPKDGQVIHDRFAPGGAVAEDHHGAADERPRG